jgi:hypothetical protein
MSKGASPNTRWLFIPYCVQYLLACVLVKSWHMLPGLDTGCATCRVRECDDMHSIAGQWRQLHPDFVTIRWHFQHHRTQYAECSQLMSKTKLAGEGVAGPGV